jgi:hypothetical protein
MRTVCLVALVALVLATSGCSTARKVLGLPDPGEPSVELRSAEARWLLIKNPRYGDVPSEPEYVWVEEDKVPTTITTLVRGKSALIAPPEIVAKYGAPPGGGKISPRQGVPYPTEPRAAPRTAAAPAPAPSASAPAAATNPVRGASSSPARPAAAQRGIVVYVDTTRIVVDLTAADGLKPGSVVSVRRDRIPIVHPVTGEVLGELDEEVATARITETRDKFSVAEVQATTPGLVVQVRDRVVPK